MSSYGLCIQHTVGCCRVRLRHWEHPGPMRVRAFGCAVGRGAVCPSPPWRGADPPAGGAPWVAALHTTAAPTVPPRPRRNWPTRMLAPLVRKPMLLADVLSSLTFTGNKCYHPTPVFATLGHANSTLRDSGWGLHERFNQDEMARKVHMGPELVQFLRVHRTTPGSRQQVGHGEIRNNPCPDSQAC